MRRPRGLRGGARRGIGKDGSSAADPAEDSFSSGVEGKGAGDSGGIVIYYMIL